MKRLLILLLVLSSIISTLGCTGRNESFDKNKLDDYLHELEEGNKAMCSVAIMKDGELIYQNYIGFESVEDGIENDSQTKFRIGSITKMFTATLIFQLIEEGKLTLDTKLSEFYPQIPNSTEITISNMLSHRSGIHSYTDTEEYWQYMTTEKTKEEMIDIIAGFPSDFQPDSIYEYSNSNYLLLGYIIEDITGSSYQHELATRITDPLNLSNTYYGNEINTKEDEAASYMFQYGIWALMPETNMSITGGAGSIVSTPGDLCIFANALFNNELVSENSLEQMEEMQDGYGRGLIRMSFYDDFAFGHSGGIDGFLSNLAYFPNEDVTVAVIANGMNYTFNNILIGVLSIYFDMTFLIPDFTTPAVTAITLDEEELKKYEGVFSPKSVPDSAKDSILDGEITLKVENGQLFGSSTSGGGPVPLTPLSKTEFGYEPEEIVGQFMTDDSENIDYDSFTATLTEMLDVIQVVFERKS